MHVIPFPKFEHLRSGMPISELQDEHLEWAQYNFDPNSRKPIMMVLGIVEEMGELAHAILKGEQGIRGTQEKFDIIAKDAIGDMFVFMMGFCNARGWSLENIVLETWGRVRQRNWRLSKEDGGDSTPTTQGKK